MKRRHPNYDHRLSRALLLVDGRRLITLRAASIVMSEVVGLSKPSSGALDYAIELLFTAAKSARPATSRRPRTRSNVYCGISGCLLKAAPNWWSTCEDTAPAKLVGAGLMSLLWIKVLSLRTIVAGYGSD